MGLAAGCIDFSTELRRPTERLCDILALFVRVMISQSPQMESLPVETFPLEKRRAIVCGSTQGIGRACALELAAHGAAVTLIARHEQALQMTRDDLATDCGQSHDYLIADFTQPETLRETIAVHVSEHGPVHILINNTGGPPAGKAIDGDINAYERAFAMHLLCNQVLAQAVAPGMRDAEYGRIINVISTSVMTPIRGLGVSNTIRGAVANWARTLADELGPFGITVNNVLPGFTATARLMTLFEGKASREGVSKDEIEKRAKATIPLRRLGEPREIAAVVRFLASPEASYVNGVNLPVDGGRLAAQ